ncbi:MAG: hypothetical protein IJC54_01585 [Clostridia bacterium]|nr:hypothetical protein [Clostridia bacterium]MBQ4085248.1 hypothetical protein [Clostridia bacterium]
MRENKKRACARIREQVRRCHPDGFSARWQKGASTPPPR